ncbi:MAG TPA: hypothetical protein VGO93_03935 [Candidatus Xenobia bacterium]
MKGHCRECGFDNAEEERYCQACNSDLAYQDMQSPGADDRQTARYRALKDASDKTVAGQMTLHDFEDFLQTQTRRLQEQAHQVMSEVHESKYDEESPDEVNLGLEGIHGYEQAYNTSYQYVSDQSQEHLEQGLAIAWEANEKLLAAMRLNREQRQAILEEFTRLYEEL